MKSILSICFALALLYSRQSEAPTIEARGIVVDGLSDRGVAGVSVSIGEQTTTTDREGKFSLANLKGGRVTLIAFKDGFSVARPVSSIFPSTSGIPLTLVAGQRIEVVVRLFPAGSV